MWKISLIMVEWTRDSSQIFERSRVSFFVFVCDLFFGWLVSIEYCYLIIEQVLLMGWVKREKEPTHSPSVFSGSKCELIRKREEMFFVRGTMPDLYWVVLENGHYCLPSIFFSLLPLSSSVCFALFFQMIHFTIISFYLLFSSFLQRVIENKNKSSW